MAAHSVLGFGLFKRFLSTLSEKSVIQILLSLLLQSSFSLGIIWRGNLMLVIISVEASLNTMEQL